MAKKVLYGNKVNACVFLSVFIYFFIHLFLGLLIVLQKRKSKANSRLALLWCKKKFKKLELPLLCILCRVKACQKYPELS